MIVLYLPGGELEQLNCGKWVATPYPPNKLISPPAASLPPTSEFFPSKLLRTKPLNRRAGWGNGFGQSFLFVQRARNGKSKKRRKKGYSSCWIFVVVIIGLLENLLFLLYDYILL